jgi:hypothetical protein
MGGRLGAVGRVGSAASGLAGSAAASRAGSAAQVLSSTLVARLKAFGEASPVPFRLYFTVLMLVVPLSFIVLGGILQGEIEGMSQYVTVRHSTSQHVTVRHSTVTARHTSQSRHGGALLWTCRMARDAPEVAVLPGPPALAVDGHPPHLLYRRHAARGTRRAHDAICMTSLTHYA